MAKEVVFKGKLLAEESDPMGYTTYVFQNLDSDSFDDRYVMCTRFPNWEQSPISVNAKGFVEVRYVIGGVDTWFNGYQDIRYKYTAVHFLKFIPEKIKPKDVNLELEDEGKDVSLKLDLNE